MKYPTVTIDHKKYILIPNEEYLTIKQDIEDLKKVFHRKDESGKKASAFFAAFKKTKKTIS